MEWLYLLIPVTFSLLSLLLWKHKITWWELLLPVVVGIITIGVGKTLMSNSNSKDVEYISEYITEARHYEAWNEYIHKTCSRTNCTGSGKTRNCHTTYYDCSYVRKHSESWQIRTNMGNVYGIDQSYYKSLTKKFINEKFIDMHRHYHTKDGDMYKTSWNNEFETVIPMTYSENYTNKTQAAKTIFKFKDLDSTETKGLYDYPKIINSTQKSCLGCSQENDLLLRKYNAMIGRRHQVKIYVLVFSEKSMEIAERQRQYWKNGNMNEVVVCVDKEGKWAKTFSWCDNKSVEVESSEIFTRDIPMKSKLNLLEHEVEDNWKRKDFDKDFSYIKVPLTTGQEIWLATIVIIATVGCISFNVLNEIGQEK